ncbi:phage antirepressor YoqD-like protein [Methylobacterium brachiatum]|uniref:Phage antirepressor YoqD-like protein n=1 Tax=Methylobacterium brachiatum TaxID=269660 RepID=A0AAJ1WWY0_9HYPH|nr:phage regulatory protein/antirepressor Ant [Methylobacterium brachiatum]MCB4805165.1 phage regulatory protein/antirepressor Ant [Methylobacterium brachiatum]MDQ0546089.1 phage antirepressor YoqD-like protein [Methylobacterium brachiatum]
MTTKEVADLTGKKSHNVMRDVRRIEAALGGGGLKSEATYLDEQGKELPCYTLDRKAIMVLVSGYSIPLRASIIDRLDELERAAAAPMVPVVPLTYPEALRLAADASEEAERQRALADDRQRVIEAQAPAVAVVERIRASDATLSVTEAAKMLKVQTKPLFTFMQERGWIFRKGGRGRWQGSSKILAQGLLAHDGFPVMTATGPVEAYTVKVTPKGVARLAALLVGVQLDLGLAAEGDSNAA